MNTTEQISDEEARAEANRFEEWAEREATKCHRCLEYGCLGDC